MQTANTSRASLDGRHLRSERSRSLIARSMLELVRETGQMPTTDAVADRAGVSRRSVFRHYADVSELLTAAYELQREEAFRRFPRRDPSQWSPEERIVAFSERSSELYEYISPVRRAAIYMSRDYPVLQHLLRGDDSVHRMIVIDLFAQMLEHRSDTEASILISALVAATGWANWEGLRREQGLSVEVARAVVQNLMRGILMVAKTDMPAAR